MVSYPLGCIRGRGGKKVVKFLFTQAFRQPPVQFWGSGKFDRIFFNITLPQELAVKRAYCRHLARNASSGYILSIR
jgi:hypothetical protein